MPDTNDVEFKYSRVYRYIKPNSTEPGTWRLSVPETGDGTGGGGGGTGGGVTYDFDGQPPIQVDTTPGTGPNPTRITTSLNINALKRSTDI